MRVTPNLKIYFILLVVASLCAFLFLFRISRADIDGDSATYLYRSWGYIDYLSSKNQTTPLQWFATVPWWVHLGFHDAPPLFFLFHQGIMYLTEGSAVAVRMVHAIFGALISTLLFFFAYRRAGLLAGIGTLSLTFAITPFIAIHRSALLESFLLIWLALGIASFIRAQYRPQYWYLAAFFFAAAMLTKYTAIFVLIGPLVWIAMHPRLLRQRQVWMSLLLFLVLTSPILIYNIAMYRTVGHPDLQFSSLLGLDTSAHWPGIQRALGGNTGNAIASAFTSIRETLFPSVWPLLLGVVLMLTWYTWRKKDAMHVVVLGSLIGSFLGGVVLGGASRYLAPFFLMAVIAGACVMTDLYSLLRNRAYGVLALLGIALLGSGGWIMSTKTSYALQEPSGVWANPLYEPNRGYEELDAFLRNYYADRFPAKTLNVWGLYTPDTALRTEFERVQKPQGTQSSSTLVLFDARTTWFSRLWYSERWNLYRVFTHVNIREYALIALADPEFFNSLGSISLIISQHPYAPELTDAEREALELVTERLIHIFKDSHAPEKIIYSKDGAPAFTIYGTLAQ